MRPSVEAALRHDGGDAETGAGIDIGGGLKVADAPSGLSVDIQLRTLVVHQAEGFREHGVAVSFSYNARPSTPLGLRARISPAWGGQAQSNAQALWGRESVAGLAHGGLAAGNRVDGEIGYGLPVGSRFVGTPRVGFAASEYARDYRIGYGLTMRAQEKLKLQVGSTPRGARAPRGAAGTTRCAPPQASAGRTGKTPRPSTPPRRATSTASSKGWGTGDASMAGVRSMRGGQPRKRR